MEITLFFTFVSSLIVTLILIPLLIRGAERFGVLDLPGERKIHSEPVARVGGIGFAVGAIAAFLIWVPKNEADLVSLWAYLGASVLILIFGVWDDRACLNFRMKLSAQAGAAAIAVFFGGVRLDLFSLFGDTDWASPSWLTALITIIVLVGITNAVNFSDGLDGLAGGLSLLSFGILAYLAYLSGDDIVTVAAVSVMGGVWGFLRFNTYPARIFMGDGGSQFLGFSLGVAAILLTDISRGPYSVALIPLIVGLPLLDTLGVIGHRILKGRSPFLPDKNHIHHKLLSAGMFGHEAVILIYAVQAGLISLAYQLRWQPDGAVLGIYAAIALPILCLFFLPSRFRWERGGPDRKVPFSLALIRRMKSNPQLRETPFHLLAAGIVLFLVLSGFIPRDVPMDFGLMAFILSALLLLGLTVLPQAAPLLIRLGLYVGGMFVVFLSEQPALNLTWPVPVMIDIFFGIMAVLVILAIPMNRETPFQITPFDYLVVLIVLMVSLLPETKMYGIALGFLAAKALVLFFAYELILNRFSRRLPQLGALSFWALMVLGIRAGLA